MVNGEQVDRIGTERVERILYCFEHLAEDGLRHGATGIDDHGKLVDIFLLASSGHKSSRREDRSIERLVPSRLATSGEPLLQVLCPIHALTEGAELVEFSGSSSSVESSTEVHLLLQDDLLVLRFDLTDYILLRLARFGIGFWLKGIVGSRTNPLVSQDIGVRLLAAVGIAVAVAVAVAVSIGIGIGIRLIIRIIRLIIRIIRLVAVASII